MKREAPVSENQLNYKYCEVCSKYFIAGENGRHSSCGSECHDNYIAIIPLKICTLKKVDCKDYLLSAD